MKSLLKISTYTIIGFLSAAINFFLMPILSHYLTREDYGTTSIINSYVMLLKPLISLMVFSALYVEYFKLKDKKEFATYFSSAAIFPLLFSLIWLLPLVIFYSSLNQTLELPNLKWVPWVIVSSTLATIFIDFVASYLIISNNIKTYSIFTIFKIATETLLTVWFVMHKGYNWEGRVFSMFLTSIIFGLFSIAICLKEKILVFNFKKKYLAMALTYGWPLLSYEIGRFVINQSDRLFIAKMVSLEDAGVYNIGYTVGSMLMLIVTAGSNYFNPKIMENLTDINESKKNQIVKYSYTFGVFLVVCFVGLNLFAPIFFKYFINKNYASGLPYVFWVSLGCLFWGGYSIFSNYLLYFEKTKLLGKLSIINVILNLFLNYLFINLFGALGAAIATCASFFIIMLLVSYFSNKLITLPWMNYLKNKF